MIIDTAQSGDWDAPSTWNGGAVPDLSVDDATVNIGHTVTISPGPDLTVAGARFLTVNGTLKLRRVLNLTGTLTLSEFSAMVVLSGGNLFAPNLSSIEPGSESTLTLAGGEMTWQSLRVLSGVGGGTRGIIGG